MPKARACEECRHQKLRCDAHLNPSNPCSRCKRACIDCVFTESFKRRKRLSKGQMHRQLDTMRQNQNALNCEEQIRFTPAPAPISTRAYQSAISLPSPTSQKSTSPTAVCAQAYVHNVALEQPATIFSPTIDGVKIESRKLEDCFSLFFQHYYPILPVFEPQYGAREYFAYSPLLFWTMVVTGSRRYTLDPTILERLAPKVAELTALSMIRTQEYIPTISALLILCVWPLPVESAYDDPSPVYAGAIIQLSLQNGLHMLSERQDFSESPLVKDANQEVFRARLWIWCRLICRSCNIYSGLPFHLFPDAFDVDPHAKTVLDSLEAPVSWMQRLDSITSRALNTLIQLKYGSGDAQDPGILQATLRLFDEDILKVQQDCKGCLGDIWFTASRLHIGAYHFMDCSSPLRLERLVGLYGLACSFIGTIATRDSQDEYALYLSEQYYRTLSLAATTILRIIRSADLGNVVDRLMGERSYFAAIQILKKRSLRNNDLNIRVATILSQLWHSQKVFIRANTSSDSLDVRIRTRGEMGIVYDCFWYWRQEFLGYADPYNERKASPSQEQAQSVVTPSLNGTTHDLQAPGTGTETGAGSLETSENLFAQFDQDDTFFTNWDWSGNGVLLTEIPQDLASVSFV